MNGLSSHPGSINLTEICTDKNKCPDQYCKIGCGGNFEGIPATGCAAACIPKSCQEFTGENCPIGNDCSIWINLKGEKVCYTNQVNDTHECGNAGYYGQKVTCCSGLVKRAGELRSDGTCDMNKSRYGDDQFPVCIACGNGKCDNEISLENKCNCPEDCK